MPNGGLFNSGLVINLLTISLVNDTGKLIVLFNFNKFLNISLSDLINLKRFNFV